LPEGVLSDALELSDELLADDPYWALTSLYGEDRSSELEHPESTAKRQKTNTVLRTPGS
jgi:hypothetical protein